MDMETLPCGLPLEMCYVNQIESGIYVTASYYGTCILDINIDKDRKNAEVYVVFYPGDIDVYGFPTYQRYNCKLDDKGNLVESLETKFILVFDTDDHQIMFKIINDDSFKKNVYKDMTQTPFSCIWINSEKQKQRMYSRQIMIRGLVFLEPLYFL